MSMPIKPTPTLYGKDADNFMKMVEDGPLKPLQQTAPPNLDAAKRIAQQMFSHPAGQDRADSA